MNIELADHLKSCDYCAVSFEKAPINNMFCSICDKPIFKGRHYFDVACWHGTVRHFIACFNCVVNLNPDAATSHRNELDTFIKTFSDFKSKIKEYYDKTHY